MKIYPYLYVGDSIKDKNKTIDKLKKEKKLFGYWMIVLANGNNQLEIFSSFYLYQPHYKKNPPYIIGITKDYDEAVVIVAKIANESLEIRKDCNLKKYLLSQVE